MIFHSYLHIYMVRISYCIIYMDFIGGHQTCTNIKVTTDSHTISSKRSLI